MFRGPRQGLEGGDSSRLLTGHQLELFFCLSFWGEGGHV